MVLKCIFFKITSSFADFVQRLLQNCTQPFAVLNPSNLNRYSWLINLRLRQIPLFDVLRISPMRCRKRHVVDPNLITFSFSDQCVLKPYLNAVLFSQLFFSISPLPIERRILETSITWISTVDNLWRQMSYKYGDYYIFGLLELT